MQAQEGKLFHPLAFTKTFALLSAFILGIVVLPTLVYVFFNVRFNKEKIRKAGDIIIIAAGLLIIVIWHFWPALALIAIGINNLMAFRWSIERKEYPKLYKYRDNSPFLPHGFLQ